MEKRDKLISSSLKREELLKLKKCPISSCEKKYRTPSGLFQHLFFHGKADIIKALFELVGLEWRVNLEQIGILRPQNE